MASWGRALSIGAALVLASAGTAAAAPTQLPVVDLSTAPGALDPDIAVNTRGGSVAVWRRSNGTDIILQAASRSAGGSWGAPVEVSLSDEDVLSSPQVTLDDAGTAHAVWRRSNGTNVIIQASVRAPGGVWQTPVDLSAAGQNATAPRIDVDAQGNATALWIRSNGTNGIAQAAFRPAGGVWQAPVDVSVAGQTASLPDLVVDRAGNAAAVFVRSDGTNTIVQAAARAAGGTWQAPANLSAAGRNASEPAVAVDPAGNATAVWYRNDGSTNITQAASRAPGGVWTAAADLSAAGAGVTAPRVTVDAQGVATAIYGRIKANNFVIQASSRAAAGTWQPPVDLSAVGAGGNDPRIAADPAGNLTAIWVRSDGSNFRVQSALRPVGGSWSAPFETSAAGASASTTGIDVDGQGDTTATWLRGGVVQASTRDVAGPLLDGLVIPAAGTAGQRLSFSVSPLDVWSPLGATTWDFGDGTAATGTTVTHTYGAPGSFAVTVTSTDAFGNASTAGRSVTIPSGPSVLPPVACTSGTVGTPPNCFCPPGQAGTPCRPGVVGACPVGQTGSPCKPTPPVLAVRFAAKKLTVRRGKALKVGYTTTRAGTARLTVLKGTAVKSAKTATVTKAGKSSVTLTAKVTKKLKAGSHKLRLRFTAAGGVIVTKTITLTVKNPSRASRTRS